MIASGRRADLLVLDGNPLDDVRNVRRRGGVMVKGRWMSEEWLQKELTRRSKQTTARAPGHRDGREVARSTDLAATAVGSPHGQQ